MPTQSTLLIQYDTATMEEKKMAVDEGMGIGWVWVTHDEDEVPVDEVRPAGAQGEAAAMRAPCECRQRRACDGTAKLKL